MKVLAIALLTVVTFFSLYCSKGPADVAGGVSDQGNAFTIRGKAVDTNGQPVSNAIVRVCDAEFVLQDTSEIVQTAITDGDGKFEIIPPKTNHFVMEINNGENGSLHEFSIDSATGTIIVNDTLRPIGRIDGNISKFGLSDTLVPLFATLVGTAYWAVPDSFGNFTFPSLPPGEYSIKVVNQVTNIIEADSAKASVESGQTRDIDTLFLLPLLEGDSIRLRTIIADTAFDTVSIKSNLRLVFRLKPSSLIWNSYTTPKTLKPDTLINQQFNVSAPLWVKIFDSRTTLRRIDSAHYEVTWSPFNISAWAQGTYILALIQNNQGTEEYAKVESIDEVFTGKKWGNVNPWAIVLR